MRVAIVCLGNICRSPAAHGVFCHITDEITKTGITINSAGTSDWHAGDTPYAPMQNAVTARGYDI